MSTTVDFYFDFSCPWTWLTSRWLVQTAPLRDLRLTWRPFSLLIKNGDRTAPQHREAQEASLRAARVLVGVIDRVGNDAAGAFYTERGYRTFLPGERRIPDLAEVLRAAQLDPALAAVADDSSLDEVITKSMAEASARAGDGVGSPIVSVRSSDRGFFGPVLTSLPSRERGAALWDHVAALHSFEEFHELKRDRQGSPEAPVRP